jgi:hypothetical protein
VPIDPRAEAIGEQLGAGTDLTRMDLAAARAAAPALRHQLLVYPITDHSFDTDSLPRERRGPAPHALSRAKEAVDDAIRELRAHL